MPYALADSDLKEALAYTDEEGEVRAPRVMAQVFGEPSGAACVCVYLSWVGLQGYGAVTGVAGVKERPRVPAAARYTLFSSGRVPLSVADVGG